ncbi:open rectifier potassium channel protein 1 [Lutzomyia longipalpis]|uniref:Potassium channel domain-containing protein n=2 Tax=Lutzomyia longipalpis TaxID=7200 RepID=A0A1B0EW23_LUTLO|nr:open rectifier potassium channel protein 1 [Lutzomyia longipalpis]
MMSLKQWLAMLAFYVSYLFFGASVFYTLEQELETERRVQALQDRIDVNELLVEYLAPYNRTLQHELLEKISVYCEKPVTNYTEDKYLDPYVWTFYHSFYFVFTVISTVGYGNISPNSTFGRMFMIFYAIIGLPINVITLATLGNFFGKTFSKLHNRYKQYKKSTNKHYVAMKLSLIAQVTLYLIPGMLIFIFLPACLFTYFEDWPYSVSVYYAFVTLTTIGFGDYACTFQPYQERVFGIYFILYEVFVIFWFVFGLGYVLMIMGFLVKAYQSRRVKQLEHKLALSLKETQSRVWNGVTKDIGFLRKMLNELHMLNFKPVYSEPTDKFLQFNMNRSESCPELTMYRPDSPSIICRKRAMSESQYTKVEEMFNTQSTTTLNRTQSDTDLAKIDRKRTFEGVKSANQTGELLAQLVTALGQYRDPDDDRHSLHEMGGGIHGFSDNEILASERTWSGWSLPTSERSMSISGPSAHPRRNRTASEVATQFYTKTSDENYEWTWSNNSDPRILRLRSGSQKNDLYKRSFGIEKKAMELPNSLAITMPIDIPPSATNKSLLGRFKNFRKRAMSFAAGSDWTGDDPEAARDQYTVPFERSTPMSTFLNTAASRRPSNFTSALPGKDADSNVLERTTIADLIRALEVIHTKAALSDLETPPPVRHKFEPATPPKIPSLMTIFQRNASIDNSDSISSIRSDRRRGSLRPTLYSRPRRQSEAMISEIRPPPYNSIDSPQPIRRRFSVRPSALSVPPGQAPPISNASSSSSIHNPPVARKISIRPSPLARQQSTQSEAGPIPKPSSIWRSAVTSRLGTSRHASLTSLTERKKSEATDPK